MAVTRPLRGIVESIGGVALGFIYFLGGTGLLLKDVIGHTVRGPFQRRGVSPKAFWDQGVRAGARAIGIVALVNLFVGMILALIGGDLLIVVGFTSFLGEMLAIGIIQELGPLLTGVIMTGFIGAALAAEIGTMVVSEEVTAMTTMSLNPVRYIVAPRLLAVIVMVPCVTMIGCWVGLVGGWVVATEVVGLSGIDYWDRAWWALEAKHVWRGLTKAFVFGVIIGGVGCYQGFQVRGGAEGVGRVTTRAVVHAIIAIIIADAVLNYFLLFRL